jgi:predicted O-methyltransferase YrrM
MVRRLAKRLSMAAFLGADRLGVHVLPKHYYTSVHDIAWLRKHREAWTGPADLRHLGWDTDRQLTWLAEMCRPYYGEVEGLSTYDKASSLYAGPGYGPIESQVLHCFLRSHRPRHIVEIGSGVSTVCMLHADELNGADGRPSAEIVCVEPFPSSVLRNEPRITLVDQPAQTVDSHLFDRLGSGDLLFIDSTHAVKAGSDLLRIYLDIIPNLAHGIFIHIHDVFLPYLYGRDVLRSYFDWQETTLLAALLTGNPRLKVLACMSSLHYACPAEMQNVLYDYHPQRNDGGLAPLGATGHFPSSLYLVTT